MPTDCHPLLPVAPAAERIAFGLVEPARLLAWQRQRIERIELECGDDRHRFAALYQPALRVAAACLQTLPALQPPSQPLWPAALERCVRMLRMADQAVCRRAPPGTLRDAGSWRYAAFLCALHADLCAVQWELAIGDGGGATWPGGACSLWSWARARGLGRAFLQGRCGRPLRRPHVAPVLLPGDLVPDCGLARLARGAAVGASTLRACLHGAGGRTPLATLLARVAPDCAAALRMAGWPGPGDTARVLRGLVSGGVWQVNRRKARLWWARDGLFLVWPTALAELLGVLVPGGLVEDLQVSVRGHLQACGLAGAPCRILTPPGSSLQALPLWPGLLPAGLAASPLDCALRAPAAG